MSIADRKPINAGQVLSQPSSKSKKNTTSIAFQYTCNLKDKKLRAPFSPYVRPSSNHISLMLHRIFTHAHIHCLYIKEIARQFIGQTRSHKHNHKSRTRGDGGGGAQQDIMHFVSYMSRARIYTKLVCQSKGNDAKMQCNLHFQNIYANGLD